jgi:chemotaxis protein MotB
MAKKDEGDAAPIIIKRVKKGGHGAHGGSWKVAFADFATAMMAFFLLMWLMGATTNDQKGAISKYFNNPSSIQGVSSVPSPSPVQGPGGSSTSMIKIGGDAELYTQPPKPMDAPDTVKGSPIQVSNEDRVDKERLDHLKGELQEAIEHHEALAKFNSHLLLDETPEGVRIQIIDHDHESMFALGSAELQPYSKDILRELAQIITKVPNRISISGHTDIRPYIRPNYTNWELSADRANSARRELIVGGLPPEKIGRVVGLSSSVLLDPVNEDSPVNRRISIVVLNRRTEDSIVKENGTLLSMQPGTGAQQDGAAPQAEGNTTASVQAPAAQ